MGKRILKLIVVVLVVLVVVFIVASQMDLSALPEPGPRESALAASAKRWMIGRAARNSVGATPAADASSADNGSMIYGMDCDSCHGKDGRHPTEIGQWMYPRVPDLGAGSAGVVRCGIILDYQEWSEIFWMPGFGKSQTDKEIWDLVHYVRSLSAAVPSSK